MQKNKRKNKILVTGVVAAQLLGLAAPSLSQVTYAVDNTPGATSNVQTAPYPFKSVFKVNGRVIDKFQEVYPGDNVVSDTVFYAKNGLLQDFKITLPDSVVFNPDNQYALTVYNVNDDGSIGSEITSEGTTSIKGQEIHWLPKDPTRYVYKKGGNQNRIVFHLNAHIQGTVNPGSYLKILTEGTIKDKDTPTKVETINSYTSLHVADSPDTPVVKSSVFKEDKDGYISALLPNGKAITRPEVVASLSDKQDSVITISSEDKVPTIKEQVAKAVKKAKEAAVPTESLEKMTSELKDDATYEQKVEVVREFERVAKGYEGVMAQAIFTVKDSASNEELSKLAPSLINNAKQVKTIDVSRLEKLTKNLTPDSSAAEKAELIKEFKKVAEEYKKAFLGKLRTNSVKEDTKHIKLENKDSKFTVVVDGRFPDRALKGDASLRTSVPNFVKVDPAKIKVYNTTGEDVTNRGKVTINTGAFETSISWTAEYSYVKELRETKADKDLQMRVGGLQIDATNTKGLARYVNGDKVTIPNKGGLVFDSIMIQSAESVIELSDDVTKSVMDAIKQNPELDAVKKEVTELKQKLTDLENRIQAEKDAAKKAELDKEKAEIEKQVKALEEKDAKFKADQEAQAIKELENKEKEFSKPSPTTPLEKSDLPKVEDKKVEDKKVEDKKVDDKKVEDKKVEDKKVDDKKVDDKKVDDKKVDDNKVGVVENDFAVFTQDDDFYYLKLKVSGMANIKVDGKYEVASFKGDVIRVPKDKIKKDVIVSFEDKEYTVTKEELDKGSKLPSKILSPQEKFSKEWQEKHKDELKAVKETGGNSEESAKLIAKYQEEFKAKFGKNPLEFTTNSEDGWFTPGAESEDKALKFFIGKKEDLDKTKATSNTKALVDYYNKNKAADNTVLEKGKDSTLSKEDTSNKNEVSADKNENKDFLEISNAKTGGKLANATLKVKDKDGKITEYKLNEKGQLLNPTSELLTTLDNEKDVELLDEKGNKLELKDYIFSLSDKAKERLGDKAKSDLIKNFEKKQADKKADIKTGIESPTQSAGLALASVLALMLGMFGYRKYNKR